MPRWVWGSWGVRLGGYTVGRVIDLDQGWCTERLDLEPLVAEHAAELGPLLDDVALHKFTGGKPLSAEVLAARYARLAHRRSPDGSWVEKAYPNVIYFNEVDKGGHFAAWEEPGLFSEELRAAFRPLR
jgi:pimeloyl-ACP methyl ester carboxylesterase